MPSVSDPELRHTEEAGIARAMFRVAVSGRRDQEASFFTVVVWRDQAEHAAQSLLMEPGRLSRAVDHGECDVDMSATEGGATCRRVLSDRGCRSWL
jgi:hypothetical protein